jgi:hypothetical protein
MSSITLGFDYEAMNHQCKSTGQNFHQIKATQKLKTQHILLKKKNAFVIASNVKINKGIKPPKHNNNSILMMNVNIHASNAVK